MSAETVYRWQGKDRLGRKVDGKLSGAAPKAVRAHLRHRGITGIRVRRERSSDKTRDRQRPDANTASKARLVGDRSAAHHKTGNQPARALGFGKRINSTDIALFSRQMATMIRAGVPLVQALDAVAQGVRSKQLATLVHGIRADLAAGATLTSALAGFPAQFDDLYRNLVNVGEQSGTLEAMLERVAAYQEGAQATRQKLKKAMTYPVLVTFVALLVTAILLIYVVPQFEAVFASVGADLPGFTRFVLRLSDALANHWPTLLGGAALATTGFVVAHRRSARFRNALDRVLLKSPIAGGILVKASVSRYARTLATTVAAGVPLVEALGSVAGSTGNAIYGAAVERIREQVAAGQPLHASMRESAMFPDMMVQMVAIGEESGSLDDMLARSATHFETQVDAAVDNLTTLVEPLMMAVLGVLIGGLIIAMYLPVFQLGSVF